MLRVDASGTVGRQLAAYPAVPADMATSTDAEELFRRYRRFRENRETIQAIAYACLVPNEARRCGRRPAKCRAPL